MLQKYLRVIVGILIVAAAPVVYWYAKNVESPLLSRKGTVNELLSSKYAITDLPANSFGELASLTTSGGRGGELANPSASSAQLTGNAPQIAIGQGGGSAGSSGVGVDSKIVPPYFPEQYRFSYKGAELGEMSPEQPVYRRIKDNLSSGVVDRIISTLSLGLIDLTRFDSAKLQNFSISEDKQFGYSIYVDVAQGMLNMYQNYQKWPQPLAECRDEQCIRANQPKLSDIPEDGVIIEIANQFIVEKNISLNGYGQPQVVNNWRQLYQASPDQANFYFPEIIDVVYPILIDGQEVYDEGGNISGLHVSVSIRERKVVGLYDLMTKQFERSTYAGETDTRRLLDIAEKGGFRSYTDPGIRGAKVITLELDTPTVQVMRMWKYSDNDSEEIFIPALVFPITNPGQFWRQNVIVPLVKDILDNEQQPPFTIMERGAGGAVPDVPASNAEDLKTIMP